MNMKQFLAAAEEQSVLERVEIVAWQRDLKVVGGSEGRLNYCLVFFYRADLVGGL